MIAIRARRIMPPFKDALTWAQYHRPSAKFVMDGNRVSGIHIDGMTALGGGTTRSYAARGEWILVADGGPVFFCDDEVARRMIGLPVHDDGSA